MRAMILTDKDGQIKDRDMLDLYDGFLALGVPTQFYTETEMYLDKYKLTKDDIVVGHVSMCRSAFNRLKIEEPIMFDYPPCLKPFWYRNIQMMPAGPAHDCFGAGPLFVKPVKNKRFQAFVCNSSAELAKNVPSIMDPIWLSDVVKFENEHRVYVYKKEIVDVFRYWGDNWEDNINSDDVKEIVYLLSNAKMPIFYSIDVGLMRVKDKLVTGLVECNDGYALGNYGLGAKQYAEMSMNRWYEIVGLSLSKGLV